MKYIKSFNENKENSFEITTKKFFEDNLAYLLDEGGRIIISANKIYNEEEEEDLHYCYIWTIERKWDLIKDDILPFLEILKDRYVLGKSISIVEYPSYEKRIEHLYGIDELISGCDVEDIKVFGIEVYIKKSL